jgi:hypothetical protein
MSALVPASNQQYAVSDIERMARAFASSKLFGVTNPEQAIALCLIAQAEGRHPASAAQDYHIIQGKPSKKADAMLRDFITGGGKVEWHELTDSVADATFSHPAGGSVRISWDHERAKQAQISTPMWKKYPRQMLRARVVSEGVRTVFPMATSGMYVPEEVVEFAPQPATQELPPPPDGVIEGEIIERPEAPPAKTLVKDQRPLWKEMADEIDACQTEEDVRRLWASRPFQTELKKIKPDWQRDLRIHRDDHMRILNGEQPTNEEAPAEFVPPNFEQLEEGQFT